MTATRIPRCAAAGDRLGRHGLLDDGRGERSGGPVGGTARPPARREGEAPAAVGHPGAVRRLLRRHRPGLLQGRGLDVTIIEGGVDIVPQTVLAQGQADYAIAWVPKALASREQGAGITDVGQIFQRSGTCRSASRQEHHRRGRPAGKKVGNWGFGNEFELFAGMTKAGLDPPRT